MSNCKPILANQRENILETITNNLHSIPLPSSKWKMQTEPLKRSITFSVSNNELNFITSNKHIVLSETNNNNTFKIDMFMDNVLVQIPYISKIVCNINDLIAILNIFNNVKFCKCYLKNHRENYCLLFTAPFIDVCSDCLVKGNCTLIKNNSENPVKSVVNLDNGTEMQEKNINNKTSSPTTKNDVQIDEHCIFCNIWFGVEENLLKHYRTHLTSTYTGQFVCTVCNELFDYVSALLRHYRQFHKDVKFIKCIKCEKKYINEQQIQEHIRNHIDHGALLCKDCNTNFSNVREMAKHRCKNAMFPKENVCDKCKKKFTTPSLLTQHEREHLIKISFKCKFCSKNFDKDYVRIHETNCKKRIRSKYVCNICSLKFLSASRKALHFKKSHGATTT